MELHLDDQELSVLRDLLQSALGDLSMEIANTDNAQFRRRLRRERDLLKAVFDRLNAPSWGMRRDQRQRLVLRHDSFERTPWTREEPLPTLATALEAFAGQTRGLNLDLKDGPGILDEVLALLERHEFDGDRLSFNAEIEALGAEGFVGCGRSTRTPSCSAQSTSWRRWCWRHRGSRSGGTR